MNTTKGLSDEFDALKKSFELAKTKEKQSLVLYQDYDMLLDDLINRLSQRREDIMLKYKVNAFRFALKIERDKYYGNGGGKNMKRKTKGGVQKKSKIK